VKTLWEGQLTIVGTRIDAGRQSRRRKELAMENGTTHVGLDDHRDSIRVAMLRGGDGGAVEWEVENEPRSVARLARRLKRESGGEVVCAYEAGPCGYVLQRQLEEAGVRCKVVAPSLTPVKPGERVKTDRRDARKLAELLRAGVLTEVHAPSEQVEAVRDLCRAREDAQEDLLRSRHRLSKFLLRHGQVYRGASRWGRLHRQWLRHLEFGEAADQVVLEGYLLAIEQVEERLRQLTAALTTVAEDPTWREHVGWLRAFRGIDTITAMTILTEVHDMRRFATARDLMAYLGVVPKEHSSGQRVRRGGITRAGNAHLRRVLVEAAWHYRRPPTIGPELRRRREGQPGWVIALSDKAQQRLHRRFWRLLLTNRKPPGKAVVAVARELAGFIWAALSHEQPAA